MLASSNPLHPTFLSSVDITLTTRCLMVLFLRDALFFHRNSMSGSNNIRVDIPLPKQHLWVLSVGVRKSG